MAQVAGYLYSGIVLGVCVPKLNIYMTNRSEAKRQARLKEQENNSIQEVKNNSFSQMLKSDNIEFLSKFNK